jgi:chromate transporter
MRSRAVDLAMVFVPLSFATIGGGQSAISGIRHQVVEVQHWMTSREFIDVFAISRMAPGPGSLMVTLIGWHVAGLIGAIVATLAIFGPTSLLVYGVARLWSQHRDAPWQRVVEEGLRPVAAGLVLAASFTLLADLPGGWLSKAIVLVATLLLLLTRVSPLLLLAMGAIAYVLI